MIEVGFTEVFALVGGLKAWMDKGYPLAGKDIIKTECVACHSDVSPGIVADWKASKHSGREVSCSVCHGKAHVSMDDAHLAEPVAADKCATCHQVQGDQFKAGKHALAWRAMKAMPSFHRQPLFLTEGMKGCGGCHRLGLKTGEDVRELEAMGTGFGQASCDLCHSRHSFSVREAQQPQACQTCHMGFDHPQWEMYASSKHGKRYLLKQNETLPEGTSAPTCQTCHMQEGHHGVRTAWGFLAVRLPMPEDREWMEARQVLLKALGALDPKGRETPRFDALKTLDVFRTTQADWEREREKMLSACSRCHSSSFARRELEKGDRMIREADILMAKAIETVAGLYEDGTLKKPDAYAYPYPDLLAFHDAPTGIEHRLFQMFMKHRMRAFQGSFHANPEYALWYGWSEMQQDLTAIREEAATLRRR